MKRVLAVVVFAVGTLSVNVAYAQQRMGDDQIAQKLPGKWRQEMQMASPFGGTQKVVMEIVYVTNGRFTAITKSGPYQFFSEGRWEIRNGILIHRYTNWSPRSLRNLDGSESPIRMPESESTQILSFDGNRIKTKAGEAIRIQ